MTKTLKVLIILSVLVLCVGCDQAVKSVARETLVTRPPVYFLDGFLRLEYAENPGAFLSLGANLPASLRSLLLVAFAGAILVIFLAWVLHSQSLNLAQCLSLALVAGGGIGNLIDRVFHDGRVVDFAVLSVGPLQTGIFNVADVALVAGVALFALVSLRRGK